MFALSSALLAVGGFLAAQDTAPAAAAPAAPNPVALIKTSLGEVHVELFADETPKTVENFLGLAEGTREFTDPKSGEKVKRPYYDGLVFHRVIKDFMIQGGCSLGNGTGGPGYTFEDEINGKALGLGELKVIVNGQPHPWLGVRAQADFQRVVISPLVAEMGIPPDQVQSRVEEINQKLGEIVPKLTLLQAYENMGYQYEESRPSHKPLKGVLAMANSGPNTNGSQFFLNLADTPHLTGKHTVFGKVVKGMDVVEKIGEVEVQPRDNRPLEEVAIISIRRLQTDAGAEPVEEGDGDGNG